MSEIGQDAENAAGGEIAADPAPDALADDPAEAPYVFDPAHVAVAVAALDAAFTQIFAGAVGWGIVDSWFSQHGDDVNPALHRELCRVASYSLNIERDATCELDLGGVWLPDPRTVSDDITMLWRETAAAVTNPGSHRPTAGPHDRPTRRELEVRPADS